MIVMFTFDKDCAAHSRHPRSTGQHYGGGCNEDVSEALGGNGTWTCIAHGIQSAGAGTAEEPVHQHVAGLAAPAYHRPDWGAPMKLKVMSLAVLTGLGDMYDDQDGCARSTWSG